MKIKTMQWNIGGGWIRNEEDPSDQPSSYSIENLDYIIEKISEFKPDIITLQETHANGSQNQTEDIAKTLDYQYFVNDVYDKSHIDENFGLGAAIISRFKILEHDFRFYYNPKLKITHKDEEFISHDKGVATCVLEIDGQRVEVKSSHAIPFRKLEMSQTDKRVRRIIESMEKHLAPRLDKVLIQGDLNQNSESLKQVFPGLFKNPNLLEILQKQVTTPRGRKYDHILYRGIKNLNSKVDNTALTDHFPIISEFEV